MTVVFPVMRFCRFVAGAEPNPNMMASIPGSGALLLELPAYARSFVVPPSVIERMNCLISTGALALFKVNTISSI